MPGLDKVVHGLVFALLALTACRRFGRRTTVAVALAGYAVATELVQGLVLVDRSGDPFDVIADLLGATCGWLLARHADQRSRVASSHRS